MLTRKLSNVRLVVGIPSCYKHTFSDKVQLSGISWMNARLKLPLSENSASGYCTKQDIPKPSSQSSKKPLLFGIGGIAIIGGSLLGYWITQSKKGAHTTGDTQSAKSGNKDVPKQRIPADSKDIPDEIPYLLIGGGTASFSAFRSIKASDPKAKVLVISDELYYPYMRPPLSKEMWYGDDSTVQKMMFKQWNGTERSLFYEPEEFYVPCNTLKTSEKGGIAVARGWTVVELDPMEKKVKLDDGKEIHYGQCLLATGSRPKNLDAFKDASDSLKEKLTQFRSIDDFKKVYEAIKRGAKSIVVIGGSFTSSELSSALASRATLTKVKLDVKQIVPEKGIMSNVLPEYLSLYATNQLRDLGVQVLCNSDIEKASLSSDKKQVLLKLSSGNDVKADHVIVATGLEPNTELAEDAGLETHPELGGFLVNTELLARSNLYSAGDCACFYDIQFGRRRLEYHDHAVVSGRLAGENMAGASKPYWHQSMFWSDLGPDLGYEGIGLVDSSLPTVGVYVKPDEDQVKEEKAQQSEPSNSSNSAEPLVTSKPKKGEEYKKGVVFYLQDGVIVGIVLWNLFSRMSIARQVLKQQKKFDDLNEVAKLFDLYTSD